MEAVVNGQSREIGNKGQTKHRTKIIKNRPTHRKLKRQASQTQPRIQRIFEKS